MVRYYGRARQRTGSVNTNQLGLKMSGCISKVGRTAFCRVAISQRVKCNQLRCGDVRIHNVVVKTVDPDDNRTYCTPGQPKSRSVAGGIGRIWSPRI